MEIAHVDPATIPVWRWHGVATTLFCAVFTAPIAILNQGGYWAMLPIGVVVLGLSLSWLWPPLYFQYLRFGVDAAGIAIERGVVWRSRIAVPRVRIQHTDVSQGPLQRRFGVGTLKLYTAGSRHTRIELPGLTHEHAIALRDALLAEGSDSGV